MDAETRLNGMVGVVVKFHRKLRRLGLTHTDLPSGATKDDTPQQSLDLIMGECERAVCEACPDSERDGFVVKVRERASKKLGLAKE